MTEEKAIKGYTLFCQIKNLEDVRDRLKENLEAKLTGLDPETPGGQDHMLMVLRHEWDLLGGPFAEFFKAAMEAAIASVEVEIVKKRREFAEL